jgi:hypothetical protein
MSPKERDYRLALLKIAEMGKGLKPEIIDWSNIGRNAVSFARETLAGKCRTCGRTNDFERTR